MDQHFLSGIVAIVLTTVIPLTIAGLFFAQHNRYGKPLLLGSVTFFVVQMVIRIPLLQYVLPKMMWYRVMTLSNPVFTALFLGGTAALFEVGGRFIVMRYWLTQHRRYLDGIAFGVGHGGIEAIMLAGIPIILTVIAGQGGDDGLLLAGGVERVSAMLMQIGWSVMVLRGIRDRKYIWVWIAGGIHMLTDTMVVLSAPQIGSVWLMEGVIGAIALLMTLYIYYEYKRQRRITS